jgi:hypothetical protein
VVPVDPEATSEPGQPTPQQRQGPSE